MLYTYGQEARDLKATIAAMNDSELIENIRTWNQQHDEAQQKRLEYEHREHLCFDSAREAGEELVRRATSMPPGPTVDELDPKAIKSWQDLLSDQDP
jgi:hypothetical protein